MTDAQAALAQVREALATGPTPGEWRYIVDDGDRKLTAEVSGSFMCDTAYYPWCPDNEGDWKLIAACSPPNIAAILAHVEAQEAEIERLRAERDNARERCERTASLLVGIHALLYPPPVTLPDGRTLVFRPENPDPHTVLQTLSDRIRALPDEIAVINDAKEQR